VRVVSSRLEGGAISGKPEVELAEREGFEPSVQVSPYDGLANRWFKPLTHLSKVDCLTDSLLAGAAGGG
jgi:hypothetical protein